MLAIGIIVVLVLGGAWAWVGLRVGRSVDSTDDYQVGGRNVGVGLGSATLLARC
jgi:urea-proton symporter